jgi:O-antigen ligase
MAASLPWSTTIFGIFATLWLIALVTAIDLSQLRQQFHRPACWLPVALFCLAVIGMFWADAAWAARIHAIGTMTKLLAIPLLIYQFERSDSGMKVFLAFLASCTVLLALSWLNWFDQRTILFSARTVGVPVKNWITQSVEFTLCIFGTTALALMMWRSSRPYVALGFVFLALAFLLNLAFVASSRTSLVALPVLLLISTFRYLDWRRALALYLAAAVVTILTWSFASNLRLRIESIQRQYASTSSQPTSVGIRLLYWSRALKFIRDAPLAGHGTGSIRGLFERVATDKTALGEQIVANPHNQTLHFAIEWGLIGVILLYAMWITHFLIFTERRWISWIGIIVVSQNVFDSLFNSHLSDYVEGWVYVLGVGIATGIISKPRRPPPVVDSAA